MYGLLRIWLLILAFSACGYTYASKPGSAIASAAAAADSTTDIFAVEKASLLQRIGFEKVRIVNEFKSTDAKFLTLVDSVTSYILGLDVSKEKQNLYLSRLHVFLQNIDRYYSDGYLKNGTYLAVLSYYPIMIEWDMSDELLRNIQRYNKFSIKAARLIPVDDVAEDFLMDYMKDYPDDIFRYAEEFDDRKFAQKLLEKALKQSPVSAKRYFATGNVVNELLRRSQDPFVRKSYEVYSRYGLKSQAFLLLDDIVTGKISLAAADSIGANPDLMFRILIAQSAKFDATVNYSMYRFMDNYSQEAVRKLNQDVVDDGMAAYEAFNKRSIDEIFVLISYGYNQASLRVLENMLEILKVKCDGKPVSNIMLNSLDKEKLKQLIIYCDQNQLLDNLFAVIDDERKNYLLELTTIDEKEELMPPFKTFGKDDIVTQIQPEYRVMTQITKARPPKEVVMDIAEYKATVPARVDKPGTPDKPGLSDAPAKPTLSTSTIAKADVEPLPLPTNIEPIHIELDERQKTILLLKKNLLNTIQNIPSFLEKDYAEEVLLYAAQKEPDEMLKRIDAYKRKVYSKKILEVCAINAPVSVKRYLYTPQHPVTYILQYSTDPTVKKILEINNQIGYNSKPLLLLDDIVNNRTNIKDATSVGTQQAQLYSALVKIVSRSKYVGRYSIDRELRDYSLRFTREINDKIASGSSQPFYAVESFNAAELYFLMLYGREEVFTSTFNGLFNRFIQKISAGGGQAFFSSVSNNRFRDFLSMCSGYGVLEEFLIKFNNSDKQNLLLTYIANLESERDNLSSVVLVAEALSNISDAQLLASLQAGVRKEYERVSDANDKIGISIYGVLSSIISGNAKTEMSWYHTIAQQFRIAPVSTLTIGSLLNSSASCVEQMYFYNDDDGRSSFINFVNTYKGQPGWAFEDKYNYIRIYSTKDNKVEILANKPEYDENGISAINAYLKERNLNPTVIVHRGHSFHTETTLQKVPASAKLVFVGSCGGFYKISIALENAPEAHIISTKQIGTKTVNDAVIFSLNENIRMGKDIVWNEFWEKMREKLVHNQYFSDYIPPNKNLEATFIKAYYKILGV